METLSYIVIGLSLLSIICLLILHFVSSEFKPSWRMISEYALGKHKWLITLFFYAWGFSSMLLALLLWNEVSTSWAKLGAALVFVSGIGALMGGLFDVKHRLHGLAFLLGIPTLAVGSLFICYHLLTFPAWQIHKTTILWSTHSIWISVVFMAISMIVLMSGFKKSGIPMGPDVEAPKELPVGVIGVNGYFNRILVLCYLNWLVTFAMILV
jgi:hypothetical protein